MLIVFNPAAGSRRRSRLDLALALLPGARLAETAGGDGTIAEVASGLMSMGSPGTGGPSTGTVLGILPLGTANVLALELGLKRRPEDAAAVLRAGRGALLWPGIARFGDSDARLFVQMLGAGSDAGVVRRLDPRLKRPLGRGAYVWQTLRELPRYPFPFPFPFPFPAIAIAIAIASPA
ncbi:MAG: diacylglycerol kinase, partial [Roseomonas sp.]|nr:diacylglycerol kinase [Roseomonas sp.]